MKRKTLIGVLCVVLASMCYGITPILSNAALRGGLPADFVLRVFGEGAVSVMAADASRAMSNESVVGISMGIACVLSAAVCLIGGRRLRVSGKQTWQLLVMGGGNAAVDAANFLTKYAKELYLIHRSKLRADKASQDKLFANPKVKVLLETEIRALHGEGRLTSITIYDKAKGEERELPVDAIFVNIGVVPNTHLFEGQVKMTESGRILAGEDCRTNIPGVFAAGDVREKEIRQLTTAAADGTTAALLAEKYIESL